VITQKEILEGYAAGDSSDDRSPAALVFPQGVEEVAEVIAWARESDMRVMPVSSGTPHRSAVIRAERYVVLDLSRMDAVVRTDRRNRVAIVEPGVTFMQLDGELARVGLRAMTPLAPRTGKSVLAAYLDRTPTLVPRAQWDLSDPLLCTELVMGTGDIFRTGCAAGPGTLEQQWSTGQAQKNPMGPSSFDFFRLVQGARGSFGVVTWISFKCELRPVEHELLLVPASDPEPLAEVVYRVSRARWGEECLVLDRVALEALTGARGMPAFALLLGVAGFEYRPRQRVAYQLKGIEGLLQAVGLARAGSLAGVGARRMLELVKGSGEPWWKDTRGDHLDICFLSTIDRAGDFSSLIDEECGARGFDRSRVGLYIQPQLGGRVAHYEIILLFGGDERESAEPFCRSLAEAVKARGAYFSRPAGAWEDLAYRDKPLLVDTFRRAKRLFDPGDVLNPDAICFREVV
jgi:FAD/FMN-containing dehydrogenase